MIMKRLKITIITIICGLAIFMFVQNTLKSATNYPVNVQQTTNVDKNKETRSTADIIEVNSFKSHSIYYMIPFSALALLFSVVYLKNAKNNYDI